MDKTKTNYSGVSTAENINHYFIQSLWAGLQRWYPDLTPGEAGTVIQRRAQDLKTGSAEYIATYVSEVRDERLTPDQRAKDIEETMKRLPF